MPDFTNILLNRTPQTQQEKDLLAQEYARQAALAPPQAATEDAADMQAADNLAAVTPGEQQVPPPQQYQAAPQSFLSQAPQADMSGPFFGAQITGAPKGVTLGSAYNEVSKIPYIQDQQRQLSSQKAALEARLSQPTQVDLSPLAGWLSATTGKDWSGAYTKPQDRQEMIQKLQQQIQQGQGQLSDEQRRSLADAIKNFSQGQMGSLRALSAADRVALAANKHINDDQMVKQFVTQKENSQKALDLLDMSKQKYGLITNQAFNDAMVDYTNAISGARGATDSRTEMTKFNSLEQEAAKLKQYISGKPTDAVPPAIYEHFVSLVQELQNTVDAARERRATQLAEGLHFQTPNAQAALSAAVAANKAKPRQQQPVATEPHGPSPAERKVLQDALSANPNGPRAKEIKQVLGIK
jgi:hypothetical protein